MTPLETALYSLPQHLGPLHPVEQALTLALAFGPFLLLGLTIWLSRRRDARERAAEAEGTGTGTGHKHDPDNPPTGH